MGYYVPRERERHARDRSAEANDKEHVEDGAANDGAEADVRLGDEDAHDAGEELRSGLRAEGGAEGWDGGRWTEKAGEEGADEAARRRGGRRGGGAAGEKHKRWEEVVRSLVKLTPPAAMNVAPATSGWTFHSLTMSSSASQK